MIITNLKELVSLYFRAFPMAIIVRGDELVQWADKHYTPEELPNRPISRLRLIGDGVAWGRAENANIPSQ